MRVSQESFFILLAICGSKKMKNCLSAMADNAKCTKLSSALLKDWVVTAFGGNLRMLLLRTHLALIDFIHV